MRKAEEPKISFTMLKFSGDNTAFKSFMNGMIHDYLNSDTVHNIQTDHSVDNVEVAAETE
ncbi:MAG: hypothetical protein NC203_07330 [Firmicutes bacterium]|nr:hypothetical protein [Bacillota bacterium]